MEYIDSYGNVYEEFIDGYGYDTLVDESVNWDGTHHVYQDLNPFDGISYFTPVGDWYIF